MDDDPTRMGELADANLAASWVRLGASGGAAIGASDRCTFVATGIPAAFFNGAFATGPVADPDGVIAAAVSFMGEREVPWLLWVREGVADDLLAAGRRAGLRDAGGPPGMVLPSIPPSPRSPDELAISTVSDAAGVEISRDLMTRGFEMPAEICERLITDPIVDDPAVRLVVGSVDATPVACALVAVSGSTAGIYNVATPPEHRRRGYGAAVTWAAIKEGERLGCDHAALQASELGAPVYRAMGFVDVGQYVQLEGPPAT
jgi:GNAT superfamily N-acetyltransferase